MGLIFASRVASFEVAKYVYTLFSEIMLPVIHLFGFDFALSDSLFVVFGLGTSILCAFISIVAFKDISKYFNKANTKKKLSLIFISLFALITFIFGIYGILVGIINSKKFVPFLEANSLLGAGAMTKYLFVHGLFVLIGLVSIAYFVFAKSKGTRQAKEVSSLYFYSDEYLQVQKEENATPTKPEIKTNDINSKQLTESNEQAKDLVQKIMDLNKLKESGEISSVEYTRLKQKAIRRYKK